MNAMPPEVSVILPVYNTERYLQACIDSLCSQTMQNMEIIIIDDGSTDRSGLIADRAAEKDPRIRVIHQSNVHIRATRNVGLSFSKGKYVIFIDADDWIEPEMISSMYEAAESNNLDLVITGTTVEYTKEKRSVRFHVNQYLEASDLASVWKLYLRVKEEKLFAYSWNKLYKVQLLHDHNLLFQIESPFEDEPFNLEFLMYAQRIGVLNEAPYHYMRNDDASLVAIYKNDFLESYRKKVAVYRRFFAYFKRDQEWINSFLRTDCFSTYCLYVHSLYKQNASLTRKQRVFLLKSEIYGDSFFMQKLSMLTPSNTYEKIFRALLLHTSPFVTDRVYTVLFFLRRHCESFYQYFRKQNL